MERSLWAWIPVRLCLIRAELVSLEERMLVSSAMEGMVEAGIASSKVLSRVSTALRKTTATSTSTSSCVKSKAKPTITIMAHLAQPTTMDPSALAIRSSPNLSDKRLPTTRKLTLTRTSKHLLKKSLSISRQTNPRSKTLWVSSRVRVSSYHRKA